MVTKPFSVYIPDNVLFAILADFKMMDLLIIHFLITIIVEAKSKNKDTESE